VRLIVANVNGVRAAARRGGMAWLAAQDADVVALQEVRATPEQLGKVLADSGMGAYRVAHAESEQAGRAGVAVLSREPIAAVRVGLGGVGEDAGRWIEAEIAGVTVVSCYVHTGEALTPRQDVKYAFLEAMTARMAELGDPAIVTGDLNIAHREVDIKNWKGNLKKAGFLPEERAYFDRWAAAGWVDLGRRFGGPGPGPYTWWSWRGQAFDNDAGWRIDHALATAPLAGRVRDVWIGRAPSYAERWSDHAPVVVEFAGEPRNPLG
jgi:exodeoxyribonuclease-3